MSAVVDSSIWIEWLSNGPIARRHDGLIPNSSECIVSTIVQHEVFTWLMRERGDEAAQDWLSYTLETEIVELDTRLAVNAAELALRHKLAMADAIIYATAQLLSANLITCDAHFEGLPGVTLFAKP